MSEVSFQIRGMTCASCVARVERALRRAAGVESATVNLATESAKVRFADRETSLETLLETVTSAGYEPVKQSLELGVGGMTCASCVSRVERAVGKLPGVLEAEVKETLSTASPGSSGSDDSSSWSVISARRKASSRRR